MLDQPMPRIRGRSCATRHLQSLFNEKRATIGRCCRENPDFPKKIKLGVPGPETCATRFLVDDVAAYLLGTEGAGIDPGVQSRGSRIETSAGAPLPRS